MRAKATAQLTATLYVDADALLANDLTTPSAKPLKKNITSH